MENIANTPTTNEVSKSVKNVIQHLKIRNLGIAIAIFVIAFVFKLSELIKTQANINSFLITNSSSSKCKKQFKKKCSAQSKSSSKQLNKINSHLNGIAIITVILFLFLCMKLSKFFGHLKN
jgi:hypothetical protein